MKKEEILLHYHEYERWIASLRNVSEERWQSPVGDGKWTVAAVVSHLLFWDQYSLNEKIPYFKEGERLETFPDFQRVNADARAYAENNASKDRIINELLESRKKWQDYLSGLSEKELEISFQIGDYHTTVEKYILDFIEHDLHHQKQIIAALGNSLF